jgi:hypothetical protein
MIDIQTIGIQTIDIRIMAIRISAAMAPTTGISAAVRGGALGKWFQDRFSTLWCPIGKREV